MTEDDKQKRRELKDQVSEHLAGVNLQSYSLEQIDSRLDCYVRGVIDNPHEHNLYEQLQLRRFFNRLNTYDFRIDEVQKFFRYYEFLKFDGTHGRQRYKLTPIQTYLFANMYGFYEDATHRLVHDVLWFIPRKFSKTTSVTSCALYDWLFGDTNAQVYVASNTFKQSQICYGEIKKVLKSSLDPKGKQSKMTRDTIRWKNNPERDSTIMCLANSADKLDGLNASTNIFDEYSQADNAELYGVLTSSMGMRENPMNIIITTASDKIDAPFARLLDASKKMLRGEIPDDPHSFDAIFCPDVDDEEGDPNTWKKVQPHLGVTVKESFLANKWENAQKTADDKKLFRVKYLNIFDTGQDKSWITGKMIRDHSRKLDIDKIGKMDCHVGVDLSATNDLSAVAYHVYLYNEKKSHIHVDLYFPEGKLKNCPNREIYEYWASKGYLKLCKGNLIDYNMIAQDILQHGKNLRILKIAVDPNRAADFKNIIIANGGQPYLYDFKQTNYYFTIPVESMERALELGALTFNDSPTIAWNFDNCVLDEDNMGNCKPMKGNGDSGKIDGVIAALQAFGVAIQQVRHAVK